VSRNLGTGTALTFVIVGQRGRRVVERLEVDGELPGLAAGLLAPCKGMLE
jgi:hypothetical protein